MQSRRVETPNNQDLSSPAQLPQFVFDIPTSEPATMRTVLFP